MGKGREQGRRDILPEPGFLPPLLDPNLNIVSLGEKVGDWNGRIGRDYGSEEPGQFSEWRIVSFSL